MSAIGYARVSTICQAEDGVSLAAQRGKISAYCTLHGLTLAGIEADEGLSAKAMDHRPALQRVLDLVRAKKVDAVVVLSLSRLVRNTRDALDLAELLKAKGVALHSISEKLDTTSAMGSFFFTIMSALAELERRQIGERTAIALRHKRAAGEKTGGAEPYGWRAVPGPVVRLKPVPEEQAVIKRALRRHRQGQSLRNICAWLNRNGIPAKQGGAWSPGTLGRLIKAAKQSAV